MAKYTALLGHMESDSPLSVGEEVKEGDKIGRMGSSGKSTAPHLHLGVLDGIRATIFRMSSVPVSERILQQLAYFLEDKKLFNYENEITFSFFDPRYQKHRGYDVVPKNRHKEPGKNFDMFWPRTKKGTVLNKGYDEGYGYYILIGYES